MRDSAHRPTPIANKASEFLESSYLNERLSRHFCVGLDKWLRCQASVLEVHGSNPAMTRLKITSLLSPPYRCQHNACNRNALGALLTNTFNTFNFCDACLYSFSLPQKLAFSTETLVLIDTLTGVIAQRQLTSRIRVDCRPCNDLCLNLVEWRPL